MNKVRVGIIGCGTIGSVHTEAYAKVKTAEVVALCDILPDKLKEKSERHNVSKTYEDYRELLKDPEIDAVSVCVPNNMHAPIAIAALEAGKHVLLEKPMTMNAELGRQILAARDASGKKLQMGMVCRQTPEAEVVREAIQAGRLGEIYQIRVKLIRRRGIPGLGGWFTTKEQSGGGGLIDLAVHYLDLSCWVCDLWNPTKVSAKTYSKFGSKMKDYHYIDMWAGPPNYDGKFDVDDFAAGFIRFGNKTTLSFEIAWACNAEEESYIELLGDKGGVKIGTNKTILHTEVDNMIADTELFFKRDRDRFASQAEKFIAAVEENGEVAATGEQGVILMKILDAIYKSSDLDSEVEI